MVITYGEMLRSASKKIEKTDAWALLTALLKTDRVGVLCIFNDKVPHDVIAEYTANVEKRVTQMPVAYITGIKEFYSLEFIVNKDVLIPRPDTEILVSWGISEACGKSVLDLCCGSGCIGISVAVNCECNLTLADISKNALIIAKNNAKNHNINAKLLKTDILTDEIVGEYDIIISNPPYIDTDEIKSLDCDVKDFEPVIALDGGAHGLDFYPIIAKKAYYALKNEGKLAVEIGYKQGDAVKRIFEEYYNNVKILKDFAGNDRIVIGNK